MIEINNKIHQFPRKCGYKIELPSAYWIYLISWDMYAQLDSTLPESLRSTVGIPVVCVRVYLHTYVRNASRGRQTVHGEIAMGGPFFVKQSSRKLNRYLIFAWPISFIVVDSIFKRRSPIKRKDHHFPNDPFLLRVLPSCWR